MTVCIDLIQDNIRLIHIKFSKLKLELYSKRLELISDCWIFLNPIFQILHLVAYSVFSYASKLLSVLLVPLVECFFSHLWRLFLPLFQKDSWVSQASKMRWHTSLSESSLSLVISGKLVASPWLNINTFFSSMKMISDRPGFQQRRALLIGMAVEFLNTVILTTTVPVATFRATYLYILTCVVVMLQCFFMAWLVVASGEVQN